VSQLYFSVAMSIIVLYTRYYMMFDSESRDKLLEAYANEVHSVSVQPRLTDIPQVPTPATVVNLHMHSFN
jgi:hypothetical protein